MVYDINFYLQQDRFKQLKLCLGWLEYGDSLTTLIKIQHGKCKVLNSIPIKKQTNKDQQFTY